MKLWIVSVNVNGKERTRYLTTATSADDATEQVLLVQTAFGADSIQFVAAEVDMEHFKFDAPLEIDLTFS